MKDRKPAECLTVAADFRPNKNSTVLGRIQVENEVLALAKNLEGTGVYLKINSALRACGYRLIDKIHSHGLKVFADLKLFDIKETLSIDGALLREYNPELLTVSCVSGVEAMKHLKDELPNTEVLGVTVLTSLTSSDSLAMFTCNTEDAILRFAEFARKANIDGLISSAAEVEMIRAKYGVLFSLNTPAIRPNWAIVEGDDQNPDRIMTPAKAIMAGADRIVVGRPITQAKNPYDAVMRTIEEISSVL